MKRWMRSKHVLACLVWAGVSAGSMAAGKFVDPLDAPAKISPMAPNSQLMAMASAGQRTVAVGWRGHIVYSDDGIHWKQASVPVSSDLTGVFFVSDKLGWAIGHGAVVLHTQDGGATWTKQLDGRAAAAQMIAFYESKAASGDEAAGRLLTGLKQTWTYGPEQPWLGLYFANETEGLITGTFGLAMRTSDGGRTWIPAMELFDNPEDLHLSQVRRVGERILVASEVGHIFHASSLAGPFARAESDYRGSFFGVCGNAQHAFAYGLRGGLFHSRDGGDQWQRVPVETTDSLVGCVIDDSLLRIAGQTGQVLTVDLSDLREQGTRQKGAGTFFDIGMDARGGLLIVGSKGATAMTMRATSK